jgi:hypothetical protein
MSTSDFFLFKLAQIGNNTKGMIAIDDVEMHMGECSPFGATLFSSYGFAMWQNVKDERDTLDWRLSVDINSNFISFQ